MNPNEILGRLQNGEVAEDIAAEMASMLNEAIDAYEAEAAKATRDTLIESAAANVVSSLLDYTNLICPELVEDFTEEDEAALTALLVNEAANIGKLAKIAISLGDIYEYEEPEICCGKADCKRTPAKTVSADEALAEFLKKNFLS